MSESTGWPRTTSLPSNPKPEDQERRDFYLLGLFLSLALIHGLVYIFLVPPWQHYDEPNHFEVVWLTARLNRIPLPGDHNPKLSRRVFLSMLENGFYDRMAARPSLPAEGEKVSIPGYPQFDEPPMYYLLASLPLRVIPRTVSIEKQLYAVRMVSLALYLFTVLAGWGSARAVAPPGHALRWLAPATLVLLPAFVDLMTAVNNDVGAVAVFSLFFWGSLRLSLQRFSLPNLLWVLTAAGLAYFTKNTAMIALAVLPVVLLFAVFRDRWQALAWGILGLGALIGLTMGVSWQDAAGWYRGTSQTGGLRVADERAVHGAYVLALDAQASVTPDWSPPVYQVLPPEQARSLHAQTVTLGAWMWASQPITADFPSLRSGQETFTQRVDLDTQPQFYALQVVLPPGSDRLWVDLNPRVSGDAPVVVYYDGLALAAGVMDVDQPPQFSAADGAQGEWGGQPFTNLLRNPSLEAPGPRLAAWLDEPLTALLPDNARPSQVLASLWDWGGAGYFYEIVSGHLFRTFWARFGWGHVPLVWGWVYNLLMGLTLAGAIGAIWGGWRLRRTLPWPAVAIGGLSLLLAWSLTLVRGVVYLPLPGYYYPTARHAYPAILPAVLALSFGWSQWMRWGRWVMWIYWAGLIFLSVLSIFSVAQFYGRF